MTGMIERVARHLHASRKESDWPNPVFACDWDDLTDLARYEFMADAKVAIEAMREPTEAMIAALADAVTVLDAYPDMIDAALAEDPTP